MAKTPLKIHKNSLEIGKFKGEKAENVLEIAEFRVEIAEFVLENGKNALEIAEFTLEIANYKSGLGTYSLNKPDNVSRTQTQKKRKRGSLQSV